ncbi:MAG: hypothetical protein MUC97_06850 [Bernardetiaceae bacterium]|nr:hypothetical protein [Bernardetiaceae bacterium]
METWAEIAKYLPVFALSMVKFIFGPLAAASLNLGLLPTVLLTAGGMMASVALLTYGGAPLRRWLLARFAKNRRRFSARSRRMVRVWRRYGMWGVAVLTPLLFTPIGGTLIAVSFGERPARIMYCMLAAALFWGLVFSYAVLYLRGTLSQWGLLPAGY